FVDRHRLKSAVEAVYGDLQLARSEALKRNTEIRVSFVAAAGGNPWCYGLKDEATTCDCTETNAGAADYCEIGGAPQIVSGADYPNADLSNPNFSGNTFTTFDPRRGTASAGSVTFASEDGTYSAEINVGGLGRVRICSDSDGMGYPGC
ncbi:MAG TPA: GspH/FimT family protein, partial [Gammaproteobacteria bacterium]|nr:GspH/FimT family protein [Gammaproteobacteria bacterium]